MIKRFILPILVALPVPAALNAAGTRFDATPEALIRSLRDASNGVATEALAQWIWASRNDVVRAGVKAIPAGVRAQLTGYFPEALLDQVRYRVGIGNDMALPSQAFRANAAAITLDHVIAFRDRADAEAGTRLWAHELTHVQQYARWGVRGFARRYTVDHDGVEREANANAGRIMTAMAAKRQPDRLVPGNQPETVAPPSLPASADK